MQLNKYVTSESIEIKRSEIYLAQYNPRKLSDHAKKQLKANIKRLGLMGGLIWNEQTSRLVSGHQRIGILDELNKYNPETKENDYLLRVEKVSLTEKEEAEQNIFLNSTSVQGEFDADLMKNIIPDIDYQLAGLDEWDLNVYGIDLEPFENNVQQDFETLLEPIQKTKDEKKDHVKQVKQEIKEQAEQKAKDLDSYVTISFSNYQAKDAFMKRLGFDPNTKFIKGENLDSMIEIIY